MSAQKQAVKCGGWFLWGHKKGGKNAVIGFCEDTKTAAKMRWLVLWGHKNGGKNVVIGFCEDTKTATKTAAKRQYLYPI